MYELFLLYYNFFSLFFDEFKKAFLLISGLNSSYFLFWMLEFIKEIIK